jgi:hypothetical protein
MPKTKSMNHSATDLPSSPGKRLPERFWTLLYLLYPSEAGCKLFGVRAASSAQRFGADGFLS